MEQLKSFEHYFLYWLRDLTVTKDVLKDMSDELRYSRAPTFDEDKVSFDRMRMMTLQEAVWPFLQGFLEIMTPDMVEAKVTERYIEDMISYLRTKEFMEPYVAGFDYFLRIFKTHLGIALEGESSSTSASETPGEQRFDSKEFELDYKKLDSKSKSVIATARWSLNECIRSRKTESIRNLEEMMELDPENWVWHYLMCSRARFLRRTVGEKPSSYPSKEELTAATNAIKSAHASNQHPSYELMCKAALCQCLAEIVRVKTDTRDYGPVTVGNAEFASIADIIIQIKEAAGEALTELTCTFAEYIRYGEILGLILPKQYRDFMVALAFMKAAFILMPTNSKVNHKMGSIILAWKGDAERAIKYFNIALLTEPHNFPAWMDYLPALIGNFSKNQQHLEQAFTTIEENADSWTEKQRAAFLFFQGCTEFMKGNSKESIRLWLSSVASGYDGFKELQKLRKRCGWHKDVLTYEALLETVVAAHPAAEDKNIQELKALIISAKDEAARYSAQALQRAFYNNTRNGGGEPREHQNREPQRWRNNSTSIADCDNEWRRPSGTTISSVPPQYHSQQRTNSNTQQQQHRPGGRERYSSWSESGNSNKR